MSPEAEVSSVEARLAALEHQVAALNESVAALRRDAPAREPIQIPPAAAAPGVQSEVVAPTVEEVAVAGPAPVPLATVAGRTCLVFGGAYLLRALAEGETIPYTPAVVLGLAYAAALYWLADRDGRRDQRRSAYAHGITAVLVGLPLVWEATLHGGAFSPTVGALVLALFTGLGVAVALHHSLGGHAIVATLGSGLAATVLMVQTGEPLPYFAVVAASAAVCVWIGYRREWQGVLWAGALSLDLALLALAALASFKRFEGIIGAEVAVLTMLAASGAYSLVFTVRALRDHEVHAFEIGQSALLLVAGYACALAIAPEGAWVTAVGWAGVFCAVVCMAGAARMGHLMVEAHDADARRVALYLSSVGLVLLLIGARAALPLLGSVTWAVLAPLVVWFARRPGLGALRTHAAILAVCAGVAALFGPSLSAIFGSPEGPWAQFDWRAWVVVACVAAAYGVRSRRAAEATWYKIIPDFVIALVALFGLAGGLVQIAARLIAQAPGPEALAGPLAATRTATLAVGALTLAVWSRHGERAERAWLAVLVLVVGGLKLVLEDLGAGSTLAIVVSLVSYGLALSLATRFIRPIPS